MPFFDEIVAKTAFSYYNISVVFRFDEKARAKNGAFEVTAR